MIVIMIVILSAAKELVFCKLPLQGVLPEKLPRTGSSRRAPLMIVILSDTRVEPAR